MIENPLVSVIIPVYNRTQYLRHALDSVFAQSYKRVEVIVVDDGSTTDVKGSLAGYECKYTFISRPHTGPSAARNAGAKMATGKYLAFLDDDDCFEAGKLEEQVRILEADPAAGFCYSPYLCGAAGERGSLVVPKAHSLPSEGFVEAYFLSTDVAMPTLLLRRDRFFEAGMFNEAIVYNEDAELWMRMAEKFPVAYSPYPSAHVRQHECRLSYKNPLMVRGLIEILSGLWARSPRLREKLGARGEEKLSYLRYVLGWHYLQANERAQAMRVFSEYRASAHRVHSRTWLNFLVFLASTVPPAVLSAGYSGLVGAKNRINGA